MSHGRDLSEVEKCEYLKTRVRYESDTGHLFWLPKEGDAWEIKVFNTRFANARIASINGNGYIQVRFSLNGSTYHIVGHRLAWYLYYGELPKELLDHINGNKSDNRLSNLRDVSYIENTRNAAKRCDNRSGRGGVHWSEKKRKWIAQCVTIDGQHVHVAINSDKSVVEDALRNFRAKHGYTTRHGA